MKKIKFNIERNLFIIALFLIQFAIFTKNILFITNYSQVIINFSICLLFCSSLMTLLKLKAKYYTWFISFLLIVISLFSYIKTNDSLLLQLGLILICSLNFKFDNLLKIDLKTKIIILVFIIVCYYSGFTQNYIFTRNEEIRYAFGFNHPNTFGFFMISLFFEIIYIYKGKLKLLNFILLFFLTLYFVSLAASRSSQMALILFLFLYLLSLIFKKMKHKKILINGINILSKIFFLIFTTLSFFITIKYINGAENMKVLDELLSERIYLQSCFYKLYDISIWGHRIDYFHTLDNVYMRVILNFGLIAWGLYVYIYGKMFSLSIRKKDKEMLILLLTFLVYGLMEWYIIRPALNIFLCYFACPLVIKEGED